jgi:hypothetical protein
MSYWITGELECCKLSALEIFVGPRIGSGASRNVYSLRLDPEKVLKVEYAGGTFHNVTEWQVWNAVVDTPIEHYFAPCHGIDQQGNVLIQSRTEVFQSEKSFMRAIEAQHGGTIPSFFDDVHYGNFGEIDGQVVCHDYGYNHFLKEAVTMSWRSMQPDDGTTPPQLSFPFSKRA